jgi:hypothetical protein
MSPNASTRIERPLLPACLLVLITAPSAAQHIFAGNANGDQFGRAVAFVGDLDDDGHDDVAVGAWAEDMDEADAGTVSVLSSRLGQALFTWKGQAAGDRFGWSVAAAGDVDGDGVPDVIAGSPNEESGPLTDAGAARVFSGRTGTVLLLQRGSAAGSLLGWAVAGAGDLDDDGYDDVVVGAPGGGAGGGSAMAFSVRRGMQLFSVSGTLPGEQLGRAVCGIGDADGDGNDDVMVGAPLADHPQRQDAGVVKVISGAAGGELHVLWGSTAADLFGSSVAGIGDVNGDGRNDFAVSALGSGRVLLFSGWTGILLRSWSGKAGQFGFALSRAGDPDVDGVPDVVVGTCSDSGDVDGSVEVLSGADGRRLWVFCDDAHDRFGAAVSGGGDANGDGYPDLLVGVPGDATINDSSPSATGSARLYSLGAHGPRTLQLALTGGPDPIGSAVSFVGDFDADGCDDFAVGDPRSGAAGRVEVFSGRNGARLWTSAGSAPGEMFGFAVAGAGDVDRDGRDDLIVGAPRASPGGRNAAGRAVVLSGGDGAPLRAWDGAVAGGQLGFSVAGARNIDGDGHADLIVGAPAPGLPIPGEVFVYGGSNARNMPIASLSAGVGDRFGHTVGGLGDASGDGLDEVVAGAPLDDGPSQDSGTCWLFREVGTRNGRWQFFGQGQGHQLGSSVSGIRDLNADRRADFVVGAPFAVVGRDANAGNVLVFAGAASSPVHLFTVSLSFGGSHADWRFGSSVSGAGDIDGDGMDDVLAGAPGARGQSPPRDGLVAVISGDATRGGQVLAALWGSVGGSLGSSVAGGGDLNGDGAPDAILGDPLDDTGGPDAGAVWAWKSSLKPHPGKVATFGAACPSSSGRLPRLSAQGRPLIRSTFRIMLRSGPASTVAVLTVGASRLHLPLDPLAPGCTLFALPGFSFPTLTDLRGRASMALPIPDDSGLVGSMVASQWAMLDILANPLGIVFSGGGVTTIGMP